ncbi:MAG: ribosomal protein S18-alanine N-acetyltransferase [bacterium]|nr:ribosomal protein S18-alanine N-acetyltransferase [bacterium]MDE0234013.1 ribosomal protein S18-alanine N-acetyltransferase [bacterium]
MVEIVPLTVDRLDEVLEIEKQVYPTPWTRQTFLDELAAPRRVYLVALVEGEVVGYGGMMLVTEEAHITTVVTLPERRRARVATRMMLELVSRAIREGTRSLTLEVRSSNQAAQALYWRFGMAPVGVRKKYYVSEDALIMWVHGLDTPQYRSRLASIAADLP